VMGRVLLTFALFALLLSGCQQPRMSVLEPQGEAGQLQLDLVYLSIYIMVFVCVIVLAIFTYVLIRFRQKPGDNTIPKQVEGSTKLEILWTVVPIILLAILAVPTLKSTFTLAAKPPKAEQPVEVKVTAHQYWWEFEYPELGIKTAQELHIPTGKKVHLELTSTDVVHSFWVPSLAGKTDLIPGRKNTMWMKADKSGTYEGRCAELCGASHALMNFHVVAEKPEEFQKWVKQRQKPSSQPQTAQEKEGKKVFAQNCMGCHAIDGAGLKGPGNKAPNLAGFSDRDKIAGLLENNPENLNKWLHNPQNVKPGAHMPAIDFLKKKDLDALEAYLESLK
jgi:cytochrome c oxidase subunit II